MLKPWHDYPENFSLGWLKPPIRNRGAWKVRSFFGKRNMVSMDCKTQRVDLSFIGIIKLRHIYILFIYIYTHTYIYIYKSMHTYIYIDIYIYMYHI
jgi:hypothetical protein